MRRGVTGAIAALAAAGLLSAAALGATSKTTSWQATAGLFKTKSAAQKQVTKLSGKGYSGYAVETEKKAGTSKGKKYEVEKTFASQKLAKTEVSKLHKAGFKNASVENEKSEKSSG